MPKTFRQNMGFIGALLDEYQKAIEEYKAVLCSLSPQQFTAIADKETTDKNCVSIQSVTNHILLAGYGYLYMIAKQFGDLPYERKKEVDVSSIESACAELDALLKHSEERLNPKVKMTDEEIMNNIIKSPWGQTFDIDQLLEHAVMHVIRHRRQIEIFKTRLQ
ncbi:MAG: DinB family protein [Bacteroidetes bacterium]|nr:DinB family protein [Bacteroidota bacterium]